MLLDLTMKPVPGGVRIDAPGLSLRDMVPLLRGAYSGFRLRLHEMDLYRGPWPREGARKDGSADILLDDFMDEVESLLLEGGGPLFHRAVLTVYPPSGSDVPAPGRGPGEAPPAGDAPLPPIPAEGLALVSEEDFLWTLGVARDGLDEVFRHLFQVIFLDHPGVARGLTPEDGARLCRLALESGGIHFNPEKWRPDPLGRVSLANLGVDFHFPCHHPPAEGKAAVVRITATEDGVAVSDPFRIEVDDYLDRWYDRPVGCRKFVQAAVAGGIVILILLVILFLTRSR